MIVESVIWESIFQSCLATCVFSKFCQLTKFSRNPLLMHMETYIQIANFDWLEVGVTFFDPGAFPRCLSSPKSILCETC